MKQEHIEEYKAYKSFTDDFEGELREVHEIGSRCEVTNKWIERTEVKTYNKDWFINDLNKIFQLKDVSEREFDKQIQLWLWFINYVKSQINLAH
jgi:hypothetical protein